MEDDMLMEDGNYDMLNKKLKNVGEGVESGDAITKHQLEVSMNTKLNKTSLNNYVKKIHLKLVQIWI